MGTLNLNLTTINGTDAKRNFPTVYNENLDKIDNTFAYSTEEQRIGTWIDGKPLYRKVYTGTLSGTQQTYSNVASFSSTNDVKNYYGSIYNSTGTKWSSQIGTYLNSENYSGAWFYDNQIQIFHSSGWKNAQYELVVEYTKTTD